MTSTAAPVAGPAMAVAGLGAALDQLAMVGADELAGLGHDDLLEVIKGFERVRNRMALVDHELVAACEATGWRITTDCVPPQPCSRTVC